MATAAKLTVLCVAQNCAQYAEVFLRSATAYGFRDAQFCKLVFFVGESTDSTEAVFDNFTASIPIPTTVIYAADLPKKERQRVALLQKRNEGHFNEGMWDFLIHHRKIDTTYYAGIHVDVEFQAPGLWNFLLNRLGKSTVLGIFDPGELIPASNHMILSMPRFFPLIKNDLPSIVVVSRVEEAELILIYSSDSYSILSGISNSRNSSTTGNLSVWGNTATYSGQTTSTSTSTPIYRKVTDGEGLVVRFTNGGRPRLLMNFKDTQKSVLERRPSTNFARKFVKVYKEVNASSVGQTRTNIAVPLYQSLASVEAPNAGPIDLNGTWTYGSGPVDVVHKGNTIKASYPSPNGCNGQNVSALFSGQVQGTLLIGKLSICTNEKLVSDCAYPAISEVPFRATFEQTLISITALIPNLNISYDNKGRCTVTSGQQQSEYKTVLTRPMTQ